MIDGDAVVHEVVLPATPRDVFAMFVEPERLVRWIGISAELEPHPGGAFRFEIVPGQFCEGRYLEVEPPTLLSISWGWTEPSLGVPPGSSRVDVQLSPVDGGTLLRLRHSALPSERFDMHDDGWRHFLDRLAAATGEEALR